MNATITAPAKFDRRAIALSAWSLVKTAGKTLSEGMKAAWAAAKQTVSTFTTPKMSPLFTIDCNAIATKNLPVILEAEGLFIALKALPERNVFHKVIGPGTVQAYLFEEGGKMRCDASNGKGYTLVDNLPALQLLAECRATGELDAAQLSTFHAAIDSLLAA